MAHRLLPLSCLLAGAVLGGCALPNPERPASAGSGDAADSPGAFGGAGRSGESIIVGRVGPRRLQVEDLLARLWMRENAATRGALEELVLAELALKEAERLGLEVQGSELDALLARSESTLLERLAQMDPPLTLDEHVRGNLGLDPAFYRRQLEGDAVTQLVAERCVRAHTLGTARARVNLLDLDASAAERAQRDLAAGEPFAAVAARAGGAEALTLMRAEDNDLARLAFATEAGQVGGPLVRDGHHVLLEVEAFLAALEPSEAALDSGRAWADIGPAVEASLAEEPVGDREFVQWRHRMVERYGVDLGAFQRLVGDPGP